MNVSNKKIKYSLKNEKDKYSWSYIFIIYV